MKNYYQILGLEEGVTLDEIKAAYREYVVKFHPDKHNGDEFFKERFQDVQEAYDYLCAHYKESDEFICDDDKEGSTVSPIQSLNSTDIELKCTKNEIYEGETITFSWHTAIPCQATISIDNGYKRQEFNDITNSGSKSIVVKRIKGRYVTITIRCYNGRDEVFKSIHIYIREDALVSDALNKSKLYQTFSFIAWVLMFLTPIILIPCYLSSEEFDCSDLKTRITMLLVFACSGIILFTIILLLVLAPIQFRIEKRIKNNRKTEQI